MSKRFVVLVLAIAGCGVEAEGDGAGSGEAVQKMASAIVYSNGTGHDYYFFQPALSWISAQIKCHDVGKLVTIGDAGENEFVRSQVAQHGGGAWWIGRNDRAVETFWVWEGNEALRFDNWAAGEPNNFNGDEDCATIDGSSGLWNDLNCNANLNFICERDTNTLPTSQNFVYSGANTNNDTQNFRLGFVDLFGDQAVTIGTCGLPGAANNGDTFLRLFKPDNATELAHNDDACNGLGSNLTFVVPTTGRYVIRAGCFGGNTCSGTVQIRKENMAPPIGH